MKRAKRPSDMMIVSDATERKHRVAVMTKRFHQGRDLWNGQHLYGQDAAQWMHLDCAGEDEGFMPTSHSSSRIAFAFLARRY